LRFARNSLIIGDKLARSDGVLCPPTGIDPAIRAPMPKTEQYAGYSSTRQSCGDPTIRPK
jgi:hypothetical protein